MIDCWRDPRFGGGLRASFVHVRFPVLSGIRIQNLSGIQRKSKGKGRISQMVYHQCCWAIVSCITSESIKSEIIREPGEVIRDPQSFTMLLFFIAPSPQTDLWHLHSQCFDVAFTKHLTLKIPASIVAIVQVT